MAFEKGVSGNPSGRPSGSRNKMSEQLRELIMKFLDDNFVSVQNDFNALNPKDRIRFYCDLLQFGLPKLQAVQLETDFERLPDDQLDLIIESLKTVN